MLTQVGYVMFASPYFSAFIKLDNGQSGLCGQTSVEHLSHKTIQRPSTWIFKKEWPPLERCIRPCVHRMEPEGDYLNLTQVFIKLPLWSSLHDERYENRDIRWEEIWSRRWRSASMCLPPSAHTHTPRRSRGTLLRDGRKVKGTGGGAVLLPL